MSKRVDWSLGAILRDARELVGLSAREAAKRTGGAISESRWRQLESGVQRVAGGIDVPISTTRKTVIAAAKVLGLDINDTLAAAGFPPIDDPGTPPPRTEGAAAGAAKGPPARGVEALRGFTDDELVNEVWARLSARGLRVAGSPRGAGEGTIRTARERLGLTVSELAEVAGMAPEAVRAVEDDPFSAGVSMGDFFDICTVLGLDPGQIVADRGPKPRDEGDVTRRQAQ